MAQVYKYPSRKIPSKSRRVSTRNAGWLCSISFILVIRKLEQNQDGLGGDVLVCTFLVLNIYPSQHLIFTCSKSRRGTLEKVMKYAQR